MSRIAQLIQAVRLKAGSQGSTMSRKAVWLAGLVAIGVFVLASGVASGSPPHLESVLADRSSLGESAGRGGRPALNPAMRARAQRAALARQRWLQSPGARAQRVRSQMVFHGMGPAAARGVLMQDFGSVLAGVSVNPAAVIARGGQIVQYRGNNSALVRTPQGLRVESSTVPLRVASGGRGKQPVDLRLVEGQGGFAPVRPLAGVSIAKRLNGGVAVGGDGLRVALLGTDVAGSLVGGQDVFFGGVGHDMDAVVAPKLNGADLSVVLRSRLAPEQFRYHVSLPLGATLSAVRDGAVVSHGSAILARIPAPSARDAQGSIVPVGMTVSGDDLVLKVAHRKRDVAYPLLVDPEIVVNITEDAGAWEFFSETNYPLHCEGNSSKQASEGECTGNPMFSHSGPGGGSP